MPEYTGEDLLNVLEKLNIEIGNLHPCVIKAWFDTDSEDVLNWLCSSITENNYISAQENSEYLHLENVLTDDQLEKETECIKAEFPDLFQYDSNVLEAEIAKDVIDILEEQQNHCDHQLKINQELNQSLSAKFLKISSEEIKSNLKREAAQENCVKLSNKLDEINSKSFLQILKYQTHLNNYEFAEIPNFINNMDIMEFEEKFTDVVTCINSVVKVDKEVSETSTTRSFVNVLSELETRLFHSKISSLAHQMEVETLNHTLKFLDNYDVKTPLSFIDHERIQLNVEFNKGQQSWMLKTIEESLLIMAEQYVNQSTQRCTQTDLNFCEVRLNYLNKVKEGLVKVLSHIVIMYELYLQERLDINHTERFFNSVRKYISKDLHNCVFRSKSMLKLLDEYNKFHVNHIENKFKLIGSFGTLLSNSNHLSLAGILEETISMRIQIEKLEIKHFNNIKSNLDISKHLIHVSQILQTFLICGPTCQIVTIPHVLHEVDSNLIKQNSSVKLAMQITQKPKDKFAEKKLHPDRNQLWMHFVTDTTKLMSLLEQVKNHEKKLQDKNL